jgi:hypothetical protein
MATATDKHSSVPEGFKEIPGYDGRYFINEHGDVWSVAKNRLMSPQVHKTKGYPEVLTTENNGRKQPRALHYLMRLAWMAPAPGKIGCGAEKYCVNHIDGNKLNNHLSNLEWATNSENAKHAWENNLQACGEAKKNACFTSRQVTAIRLRVKYGESAYSIAKELNVAHGTVKKICRFEAWRHQDKNLEKRIRTPK